MHAALVTPTLLSPAPAEALIYQGLGATATLSALNQTSDLVIPFGD